MKSTIKLVFFEGVGGGGAVFLTINATKQSSHSTMNLYLLVS